MKVFSIYINDTEGHLTVCANSVEEVMDLIENDEDSPLFDRDLSNETVDIYEEDTLQTTHTEPTIINWMINEYVNF